jgi:hypothetical protein
MHNLQKIELYCTLQSKSFLHLVKGSLTASGAFTKGNQIPF